MKHPIWLSGGHFESDIAKKKCTLSHGHKHNAYEFLNGNSETWVTLWKPCQLHSPYTQTSNMTTRPLFESDIAEITRLLPLHTGDVPVKCRLLIFRTKLKLESENRKIQYGCQAAILKVTSLTIKRLLSIATITCIWNLKLKFQGYAQGTMSSTDGRTDGRTDKVKNIEYPNQPRCAGYNDYFNLIYVNDVLCTSDFGCLLYLTLFFSQIIRYPCWVYIVIQ